MRIGKYIKAAFANKWNLLFVAAGTAFSFLTGRPDIALPLMAAGEIAYLGLLASHPKFQRAVDAQDAKAQRATGDHVAERALDRIRRALPPESIDRYESLRARCVELRQIASDLRTTGGPKTKRPLEALQLAGLDRLLWIHLRLLYTEHSLRRFLEQTSDMMIRSDIDRLEEQLTSFGDAGDNPRRQKAHEAIEDNLATSRARLENLEKARENHELVVLEIDRLENKIRSLSEMAVNRQEPDFISHQVDSVATSMLQTERTMEDLDFATGLAEIDEAVPELLSRRSLDTL